MLVSVPVMVKAMGESLGREETTKCQAKASRPLPYGMVHWGNAPQTGEIEYQHTMDIARHATL